MRLFKNPLNGFKYAVEGVVHVLRTQRHMRFHFLTLVLVLVVSLVFRLDREEVLILLFTVSLVLAAEMFNTAIEAVVDLVTQTYHPLAKFAKDIAAGAVLITTINALAVGFLLFFGGGRLKSISKDMDLHTPQFPTVIVGHLPPACCNADHVESGRRKGKTVEGWSCQWTLSPGVLACHDYLVRVSQSFGGRNGLYARRAGCPKSS